MTELDPWEALRGATDLLKKRGLELREAQQRIGDQRHANRDLERQNIRYRKALEEIVRRLENTGNELEMPHLQPIANLAKNALSKTG